MKKIALSICYVLALAAGAVAQKLPNKQEKSVWAPADIKIDGLTTEWQNQFQAYNKATDLFYTISNNDKNLYLTIQTKYKAVITKIILGGITFAVNSSKSDKNSVSITYPLMEGIDRFTVINRFASKYNDYQASKNEKANGVDVKDVNETYNVKVKLMKVNGIESITEPTISVYNETGIKTAARFDNKLIFTYELAIPLSYLKFTDKGTCYYHIRVNEPAPVERPAVINSSTPPPPPPTLATDVATTDFWGQYTLAKK